MSGAKRNKARRLANRYVGELEQCNTNLTREVSRLKTIVAVLADRAGGSAVVANHDLRSVLDRRLSLTIAETPGGQSITCTVTPEPAESAEPQPPEPTPPAAKSGQYDCAADVLEHKRKVTYWLNDFAANLQGRAKCHDDSKLKEPEKSIFDRWTPNLKSVEFGSDEYKAALAGMGEGLKHHYQHNSHHPEHFANGVNGMTILDLVEMFCDWLAAAEAKSTPVNLHYLAHRFGINSQLADILLNTLRDTDFWNTVNGVPVTTFAPTDYRP